MFRNILYPIIAFIFLGIGILVGNSKIIKREDKPSAQAPCWYCGSIGAVVEQRIYSSFFRDKSFTSSCCTVCRDTLLMGQHAKYTIYNDTLFSTVVIDPTPRWSSFLNRPIFIEVPMKSTPGYYEKVLGIDK